MVEFRNENHDADVATIHRNDDEIIEVSRLSDGNFNMTIYNRRPDTDIWDDLSATLRPAQFLELGRVAELSLCAEKLCTQFGKVRSYTCGCHVRFGKTDIG